MLKVAIKKLLVSLGYQDQEIAEGFGGTELQQIEKAVSSKWYYWSAVVVLAPVLAPYVKRGIDWLDNAFKGKTPAVKAEGE